MFHDPSGAVPGVAFLIAGDEKGDAAVVVGILREELEASVTVELPGGTLDVAWEGRGYPVFMTGPAAHVFEGRMEL